jgi:predicted nucleotidyltransferase
MDLRIVPDSLNCNAVTQVDARLQAIREAQNVKILLAIESGSRAWGFPSPDSDYDCRFLFVRKADDYLSLFEKRDVIETPLEGEMDVNGWDLKKSLKLLLKGNAVVIEWLTSPIIYGGDEQFRRDMTRLAEEIVERSLVARHYLHLGVRQRHAYFADGKEVALKKIFYALRPAAALRWLRLHPNKSVAPMHFPTLMDEIAVPKAVAEIVSRLIEQKAKTRELGKGVLPRAVGQFIDKEFETAKKAFGKNTVPRKAEAELQAEQFFRATLARFPSY